MVIDAPRGVVRGGRGSKEPFYCCGGRPSNFRSTSKTRDSSATRRVLKSAVSCARTASLRSRRFSLASEASTYPWIARRISVCTSRMNSSVLSTVLSTAAARSALVTSSLSMSNNKQLSFCISSLISLGPSIVISGAAACTLAAYDQELGLDAVLGFTAFYCAVWPQPGLTPSRSGCCAWPRCRSIAQQSY
jgi:hypothetical protein